MVKFFGRGGLRSQRVLVAFVVGRVAPKCGCIVGRPSLNLKRLSHIFPYRLPNRLRLLNDYDLARLVPLPHLHTAFHHYDLFGHQSPLMENKSTLEFTSFAPSAKD